MNVIMQLVIAFQDDSIIKAGNNLYRMVKVTGSQYQLQLKDDKSDWYPLETGSRQHMRQQLGRIAYQAIHRHVVVGNEEGGSDGQG